MSLMLPGSYSQPYKDKAKKRDDKISHSDIQSEPENIKSHEERTDPDIVKGRTSSQSIEHSKTQPPKDSTPIYTEPPHPGYDEYGKELGKDARVWKTYVQEASRWDADLVDGWNRSLDLILIFAALFSAISTAFVIESSKKLQEDPAEASAKTLSVISQTLFLIANNQPGSPLNLTTPESDRSVIPASAVWINTLWFLSLSLSIAVSLVAMLAKDWARGYVAELTGQPYQQARKRQRRWDGLKEWRVPEVIMFLPSLLHLALLLFSVGLNIYLWNIHLAAAIPVLVVTVTSVGAYSASTALPLLHEHCPYSTPLSKVAQELVKLIRVGLSSHTRQSDLSYDFPPRSAELLNQNQDPNEDLMDELTSRALAWLITSYEDTNSLDVALQAIAGADHRLPLQPLDECGAHSLIGQKLHNCFGTRFGTNNYYLKDNTLLEAVLLYSRALTAPKAGAFLFYWQLSLVLKTSLCLLDGVLITPITRPNQTAFALAAVAMNNLDLPVVDQPRTYIALTTHLLQLHLKDQITLEKSALLALLRAAAHWPKFPADMDETFSEELRVMMALVQLLSALLRWDVLQIHGLVGTTLTAFAYSRQEYVSGSELFYFSLDGDWRFRNGQALDMVLFYERSPPSLATQIPSLIIFGLLELFKHYAERMDGADLRALYQAFESYTPRPAIIDIYGLPTQQALFRRDFNYILTTLTPFLTTGDHGVYAWSKDHRAACLAVFNAEFLNKSLHAITIYALSLENLRSARTGLLKGSCCNIICQSSRIQYKVLADGLKRQNLLQICLEMLAHEDERIVLYIMQALQGIIHVFTTDTSIQPLDDRTVILQPLLSHKPFINAMQNLDGSNGLTIRNLGTACLAAWIPYLEGMQTRIPRHVDESDILRSGITPEVYKLGEAHRLRQRFETLLTQNSKLRTEQRLREPVDWS